MTGLNLVPSADAALRRQARNAAVRNGHRVGRFRRDASRLLRASCATCAGRMVVDETSGVIGGVLVGVPCEGHR